MEKQDAIEQISINGVDYIRADSLPKTDGEIKIVIADRGFVYVGLCEEQENFVRLTKAKNIRVWGTKNGIGELVNGPLQSTKLDPVGTIRIPNRAVISLIEVDQKSWKQL